MATNDKSNEKKKPGRKPQWTDAKVDIMCKAIANGKSYKDAYTAARVSHTTFYAHLNNDTEFLERIKRAEREYQEYYDSQLVVDCKRSLLELIRGYEWDEITTETIFEKSPDGKKEKERAVKRKIVHKKAAPNATAIIFALCNRAPAEWSNKHIQELTGKIETETKSNISLQNVPDELLAQVIDAINGK